MNDLDAKAHQIVHLVKEFIPLQEKFIVTRERSLIDRIKVLKATINVRLIEYEMIQKVEKEER